MDGIKKTALFLSGLEWKTVDVLLGRLDPEQARAVRREMMSLSGVSVRESGRLAGEFLRQAGGRRSNAVMEHQLAAPMAATYAPPQRKTAGPRFSKNDLLSENDGPSNEIRKSAKPFEFFRNVDAEEIVREIASEHPQTVAVVLAHLPASLAGEVLGELPVSLQIDVARRLSAFGADSEPMDETILRDIETSLRERFELRKMEERRRARSHAAVQHILQATDAKTQARVRSQLERPMDFDDLDRLGNAELSRLFRSVDSVTAMLSLVGAKPSLIERVTRQFTPTEEHEMRRQLKRLGAVTEADVRRARNAVLAEIENGEWRMENERRKRSKP